MSVVLDPSGVHRFQARSDAPTIEFRSVHIVSDIDGTVSDEGLPEAERVGSVGPAKLAFAEARSLGAVCSLMSSRTVPECVMYRDALGIDGYVIAEDGGVIQLPSGVTADSMKALQSSGYRIQAFADGHAIVLSRATTADMKELLLEVSRITQTPVISSVTSSAAELEKAVGHGSVELAQASMARVASAYTKGLTDHQAEVLATLAVDRGIRVLHSPWDHIHQLFGTTASGLPADKGNALAALLDVSRIVEAKVLVKPLVIGNGRNDVPLFQMALQMGGIAIVVPGYDGSFRLDLAAVPDGVIRASQGAGYGIHETLGSALRQMVKLKSEPTRT